MIVTSKINFPAFSYEIKHHTLSGSCLWIEYFIIFTPNKLKSNSICNHWVNHFTYYKLAVCLQINIWIDTMQKERKKGSSYNEWLLISIKIEWIRIYIYIYLSILWLPIYWCACKVSKRFCFALYVAGSQVISF